MPFATPFVFDANAGNLCWELRFLNNTATGTAADATSSTSVTNWNPIGLGCIATGQSSAAAIGTRSLSVSTGAWRNRLDRGAMNAPAVFFVGFQQLPLSIPGLCSQLELLPVADLTAQHHVGHRRLGPHADLGSLAGFPSIDLLGQFAFIDQGLPLGVGLSNASRFTLPLGATSVSRIYAAPSQGGAGNESRSAAASAAATA